MPRGLTPGLTPPVSNSLLQGGRAPFVESVGLLLFVAGAVRQLDEPAAVALVEPTRALVLLKDPEPESTRSLLLDDVEKRGSHPAILLVRMDVDMFQQVARERSEPDDTSRGLRNPHLVRGDHLIADPCADLIVRVERRQEGQTPKRRDENLGNSVGLAGTQRPHVHAA